MSRRFYNHLPQGEGIFPQGSQERTIYEALYNHPHVGTPHHSDYSEENSESEENLGSEASSFPDNILEMESTNDIAQVGAFTVTPHGQEIKCQSQFALRRTASIVPIANPIELNTSDATYPDHELDQEPDHLSHNSLRPSSSMQKPIDRIFGCFRRLWVRDDELEIT